MKEHWFRHDIGVWLTCCCESAFTNHKLISYGSVPLLEKRMPGQPGDINLWNI